MLVASVLTAAEGESGTRHPSVAAAHVQLALLIPGVPIAEDLEPFSGKDSVSVGKFLPKG